LDSNAVAIRSNEAMPEIDAAVTNNPYSPVARIASDRTAIPRTPTATRVLRDPYPTD